MSSGQGHPTDCREVSGRSEALLKVSIVSASAPVPIYQRFVGQLRGWDTIVLGRSPKALPDETKIRQWVVNWWQSRAPEESWPPFFISDSLSDMQQLYFLVTLPMLAWIQQQSLIWMQRLPFVCTELLSPSCWVLVLSQQALRAGVSWWKSQAPAKPLETGTISDVLFWLQASEALAWPQEMCGSREESSKPCRENWGEKGKN